jgi:WD40 repeat protein
MLDLRHADRMKLSPDGTMLAAHVTTPAGSQVVVEDLATHTLRKVTPDQGNYGFPCWSKDSKWIAVEDRTGGRNTLNYLPVSGGEIRRVNTGMPQSMAHDWSPDSDKIVFAGLSNGAWNIYWVSRSTGRMQQLTHFTSQSGFVRYPAWSPKNDQIVFEKNDASANIYIADLR